jgi:hypothetical protein
MAQSNQISPYFHLHSKGCRNVPAFAVNSVGTTLGIPLSVRRGGQL